MSKSEEVPLDPDDLDWLDEAILDFLREGRYGGNPWGIGTPAVVRAHLVERLNETIPTRQTINNRMKRMEIAGHLKNRYDKGEYELISDPRYDDEGELDINLRSDSDADG